jgi:hypothetical protein
VVEITLGYMPMIPIDSKGLASCRLKLNKADMIKACFFQAQSLAASASAYFN